MIPAVGQGIIAAQCRKEDENFIKKILKKSMIKNENMRKGRKKLA